MQNDLYPMADGVPNSHDGVSVHRGFPNPATDNYGRRTALALDLNALLINHPSSTFLFRIAGHHWTEQGIFDGDIAIIDRALTAHSYDIVLVWLDDNFELYRRNDITENQHIWGVVSAVIHPRPEGK
jgi:SOS-response transcriptional repressor LexA